MPKWTGTSIMGPTTLARARAAGGSEGAGGELEVVAAAANASVGGAGGANVQ